MPAEHARNLGLLLEHGLLLKHLLPQLKLSLVLFKQEALAKGELLLEMLPILGLFGVEVGHRCFYLARSLLLGLYVFKKWSLLLILATVTSYAAHVAEARYIRWSHVGHVR